MGGARQSWKIGRLADIPPADEAADLAWWQGWARDPDYGVGWHSFRQYFGITAFGVNAYEASAGKELVVRHSETEDDCNEELYFVVRGRARFRCDGEGVGVSEGELLYVRPKSTARQSPSRHPRSSSWSAQRRASRTLPHSPAEPPVE